LTQPTNNSTPKSKKQPKTPVQKHRRKLINNNKTTKLRKCKNDRSFRGNAKAKQNTHDENSE